MNPESYDYRVYDISNDDGNEVIIDGRRDFGDIDPDGELDKIKKAINAINDYDLEVYYDNSKKDYIKYGLLTEGKDNGKDYSPKEVQVLWDALWEGGEDSIATILSIIHCKRYEHTGLCGCSQGDYVEAYYPVKTTSKKYLDWIEAWYFGTGTEIMIHEGEDEPEPDRTPSIYYPGYLVGDMKQYLN